MENRNSPEYIQTSLAAAISLGFEAGSFKEPVKLTGLNLLLTYDEGCIGKCAYCGISVSGHNASSKTGAGNGAVKNKKTFIRVKWPVYKLDDVLGALRARQGNFKRVCISMITHGSAIKDTVFITEKIKSACNLPVSLLITPTLINKPSVLKQFKDSGAEMIGVAIDTATEKLFEKYRGAGVGGPHGWEKYWKVLDWSVEVFGRYMAGIHLMVGLGETEKDAVETIYRAHLIGAKTHLFSFYPESGSRLEDLERPGLLSYRKVQIARYLINEKNLDISAIVFNDRGDIVSFDYDTGKIIDEGYAFMTSGCQCSDNPLISACNRPFANERPSEIFRNYPYMPTLKDKEIIKNQVLSITR
jgi:biotin synthase